MPAKFRRDRSHLEIAFARWSRIRAHSSPLIIMRNTELLVILYTHCQNWQNLATALFETVGTALDLRLIVGGECSGEQDGVIFVNRADEAGTPIEFVGAAFRYFLAHEYSHLIVCPADVFLPPATARELQRSAHERNTGYAAHFLGSHCRSSSEHSGKQKGRSAADDISEGAGALIVSRPAAEAMTRIWNERSMIFPEDMFGTELLRGAGISQDTTLWGDAVASTGECVRDCISPEMMRGWWTARNSPISVITAVRNRAERLRDAIKNWRTCPQISEIVVCDWTSAAPVSVPKDVRMIRVERERFWRIALALNLSAQYAVGELLLKLDVDYRIASPAFIERIRPTRGSFSHGGANIAKKHEDRYLCGTLCAWREDFWRVNGYNEQFVGYGYEDDDLYNRLRKTLGLRAHLIRAEYGISHLPHGSRFKEQPPGGGWSRNRASAKAHQWSREDKRATYVTNAEHGPHIVVHRHV